MKLLSIIPSVLRKIEIKKLNKDWQNIDFILSNKDKFTKEFKNQHADVQEIEHQLGRYLNMMAIAEEIKKSGLTGDLVEFGTWQGLGLILFNSYFMIGK